MTELISLEKREILSENPTKETAEALEKGFSEDNLNG